MGQLLLLALIFVAYTTESQATEIYSQNVFGVPIFFKSKDATLAKKINDQIEKMSTELSTAWDPDCYYRPFVKGICISSKSLETESITELAQAIHLETSGFFNIATKKKGQSYRDFGGIAQGYFLEKLKNQFHNDSWKANFSGDFFVSASYKDMDRVVQIADPLLPNATFATVEMKQGGWVFFSGGPSLGTELREKSGGNKKSSEYIQVVVVAKPTFNGARADAYATALMVGGSEVLKKLQANKNSMDWGAIIFPWHKEAYCTENLRCNFKNKTHRSVEF